MKAEGTTDCRRSHRLEELVQRSQKRQVACGKNGTSAAILGKRRLLGERMLAVYNAGIWRTSG
jgi:hypothetical protein